MKVLFSTAIVTGASGFLGRVLVSRLLEMGIRVLVIDRQPLTQERAGFHQADIARREDLEHIPHAFWLMADSTVLFHLAGLAHARSCREAPSDAVAINVVGTMNVVDVCYRHGVKRMIFPSTGLVYGHIGRRAASEKDSVCPTTIYAATKLSAEALLEAYAGEFGISCDVVRLGNVYGWTGPEDSVCFTLLRQALKQEPLKARTLRPVRDFIYVRDVVEALILLVQSCKEPGFRAFNLATGRGTSIGELVQLLSRVAGLSMEAQPIEPEGVEPIPYLVLSIEQLQKHLGWSPSWSLEAGIKDALYQMQHV